MTKAYDRKAYAYVTMTDKFMSSWGMAQGRINKLVISCNSLEEAYIVADNAESRKEMCNVNIRVTYPYYSGDRYFVSRHGRAEGDYDTWFEKGAFA